MEVIAFQKIRPDDHDLIELIAEWYFKEWSTPFETTLLRLTDKASKDVIFQLVLTKDGEPAATAGLYNQVGLLSVYPELKKFKPWIASLYTASQYRNQGYGNKLLAKMEEISLELGYKELYLHTYSAERLYLKNNWKPVERLPYKGYVTVVMKKEL